MDVVSALDHRHSNARNVQLVCFIQLEHAHPVHQAALYVSHLLADAINVKLNLYFT